MMEERVPPQNIEAEIEDKASLFVDNYGPREIDLINEKYLNI